MERYGTESDRNFVIQNSSAHAHVTKKYNYVPSSISLNRESST